jgi:transcription factor TFIIIB component B''
MKTLSRMTGKDFSGPVPEIRAPPPMPMVPPSEELPTETNNILSTSHTIKRRRSKSQGITESGVVIIGDVENF